MESPVLTTANVPPLRVVVPIVAIPKDNLMAALIATKTVIVQLVLLIIIFLVFHATNVQTVRKVLPGLHLRLVAVHNVFWVNINRVLPVKIALVVNLEMKPNSLQKRNVNPASSDNFQELIVMERVVNYVKSINSKTRLHKLRVNYVPIRRLIRTPMN